MTIDVRPPQSRFHPGYISGRWYGQMPMNNLSTLLTASRLYFFPVPIFYPVSIASIGVKITLASTANGKARLGLYSDNGTGVPIALLGECASEVPADSTTITPLDFASPIAVPAGIAWLAMMTDASATPPTVRAQAPIGAAWLQGGSSAGAMLDIQAGNSAGYIQTITYGALPAVGSLTATPTGPFLGFKAA